MRREEKGMKRGEGRQEEDKIRGGRSEEKKGEERGEEIVIKRKNKGMKNGGNVGFIS